MIYNIVRTVYKQVRLTFMLRELFLSNYPLSFDEYRTDITRLIFNSYPKSMRHNCVNMAHNHFMRVLPGEPIKRKILKILLICLTNDRVRNLCALVQFIMRVFD